MRAGKEMLLAMFPSLCGPCEERQKTKWTEPGRHPGREGVILQAPGVDVCVGGVSLPPSRP